MTVATTPWVSAHTKQNQERTQWNPIHSNPEVLLQTTTRMTDIDRNSTSAHGENWTQEPQPPFNNHEYQDEEETPHATSTTWADPNSTTEEAATQKEKWFENEWQGKNPPTPSEDSHVTEGTTGNGGFHNVGGIYLLSSVLDIEDIAHKDTDESVCFLIHHVEANIYPESKGS